tara:strand:+ start:164 stop:814 length:651 start_codon:yes stop_codon:yes gene_type:complete
MDTLFRTTSAPFSGDRSSDATANAVLIWMSRFTHSFGTIVTPGDSVQEVIRRSVDGDVITMMPGTYKLKSHLLLNKAVELRGFGKALVSGSGLLCKLSAAGSSVSGIRFSSTGTSEALQIDAPRCRVVACWVDCPGTKGMTVTSNGDSSSIGDCYFEYDSGHSGSLDYDIYWDDAATNGRVWGTTHSTTRAYVLSHRTADNLTEAANGRSAVINAR